MIFLAYGWRVTVNLLSFIVVWAVTQNLHGSFEHLVIASIGLTYVAIRSIAIHQAILFVNMLTLIDDDLASIRHMLGDDTQAGRLEARKDNRIKVKQTSNKLYIDGFFLSLIGVYCAYMVVTAQ